MIKILVVIKSGIVQEIRASAANRESEVAVLDLDDRANALALYDAAVKDYPVRCRKTQQAVAKVRNAD